MILINAWFFLTNVIYIDTNRHYIYIEKSCWNTMVHLIWKRRRPRLDELQHFKNVCYDVYFEFTTTQKVNHELFNKSIKQYQLQSFNLDEFVEPDIKPKHEANVLLNDGSQYIEEEYIDHSSKPDLTENQLNHVLKISYNIDAFEEEVELFINHQKSISVYFDSLVKVVGYGRIKTIFRILLQTGEIKLHNIYEFKIVELAFYYNLHKHIINITNYTDCKNCNKNCMMHIRYFFLCQDCLSVNRHNKMERSDIPISERTCKNFTWFGKQGKIIENKFASLTYRNIIIKDYSINKTSNIDYYSVLHNLFSAEQKQKQVDQDNILKEMIDKQINQRPFSGFSLNEDILDRKNKLLQFNKKQEVFNVDSNFSSVSPTKTLTETLLVKDDDYIDTLPSPLFTNNNNKSVSFEAGDLCPDCESVFMQKFGSIKCKCRTISTSFSGSFSFLTKK